MVYEIYFLYFSWGNSSLCEFASTILKEIFFRYLMGSQSWIVIYKQIIPPFHAWIVIE